MSLPVYSTRFYQGHAVDHDTFVVPDGFVWVITTVIVFIPGDVLAGGAQVVRHDNLATIFWVGGITTVLGSWQLESGLRCVCEAGETYDVSGEGAPDVTISGYSLSQP